MVQSIHHFLKQIYLKLIKNPTLFEYSTFYESIQIFQYLKTNQVKLTPSLWLYVIHSNNAEMIFLLEENHVELEDKFLF